MTKTWNVPMSVTVRRDFTVIADSAEQARDKALELKYESETEDLSTTDWEVVGEIEEES